MRECLVAGGALCHSGIAIPIEHTDTDSKTRAAFTASAAVAAADAWDCCDGICMTAEIYKV